MAKREIKIVCKSVFKNGSGISRSQFTKKWIEMINRLEKTKKYDTQNL